MAAEHRTTGASRRSRTVGLYILPDAAIAARASVPFIPPRLRLRATSTSQRLAPPVEGFALPDGAHAKVRPSPPSASGFGGALALHPFAVAPAERSLPAPARLVGRELVRDGARWAAISERWDGDERRARVAVFSSRVRGSPR